MIDVLIPQKGVFEISDQEMTSIRDSNILKYKKILASILLFSFSFLISITLGLLIIFWLYFLTLISVGSVYLLFYRLQALKEDLNPAVGSFILIFDKNKKLINFRVRKWMKNSKDSFTEEEIRFNQSIGFKVIWKLDGLLELEIIVDPEFPGSLIFTTYDFYSLAEIIVLFQLCIPELDNWHYRIEDGAEWPLNQKKELNEDILATRVPWNVREYFLEL